MNYLKGLPLKDLFPDLFRLSFNEERFISESIESVFAQTYPNWELLLVDDGSSDQSLAIAKRYAHEHPGKVRLLEHPGRENRGMSASRNLGIEGARGEYVAFVDADDVWLPHKLERQAGILESYPGAGMVYGPTQYWFSWTGSPEDRERDFVPSLKVPPDSLLEPPALLIENSPIGENPAAATCTFLVRREAVEKVGGFEDSFRGWSEDLVFLSKIYLTEKVFVSSEYLARYRMHPDSHVFVATREGRLHSTGVRFFAWLEDYLEKQGVRQQSVWRAVRKASRPYRHPTLYRMWGGCKDQIKALRSFVIQVRRAVAKAKRVLLRKSTGSILASPNPVELEDPLAERFPIGTTTLSWTSGGTTSVEVHVDSPDGPLLHRAGPSGSAATGKWVHDGMAFYLQDISHGTPLTSAHTLDVVHVKVKLARPPK